MAGVFQVLWGQSDGSFQTAEVLTGTDGEQLIIPASEDEDPNSGMGIIESICTRPFAVDWDADGDLDLVVGSFGGSFYLFRGEGEGRFLPKPEPLRVSGVNMAGGDTLKIAGQHSDPFVIDWDNDGDLDLLSGSSSGGVQWAENTAGAGQTPVLGPFEYLVRASEAMEYGQLIKENELTGPTASTRVWADDVNADGKLDLLVGDNITLTAPAPGITEEEYREQHAAWQQEIQEASEELAQRMTAVPAETSEDEETSNDTEASEQTSSSIGNWLKSLWGADSEQADPESSEIEQAQEKINELYGQRSEFMRGESTGFVWLYLQK